MFLKGSITSGGISIGAKSALENFSNSSQVVQYQRKIQELEQIIGKQAIVIQSKKTVIHPGGKQ
ncbi:hypothetical protein [Thermosipho globiformans]|uniref:hypothetical protein n=1 Tax=Thermosipho globiformans TaxID=380685 RepID=UPI003570B3BB